MKILYLNDFIGSTLETPEEEFESFKNKFIENFSKNEQQKLNIKHIETFPDEMYDVLIFDWGGALPGNDIGETFIRYLVKDVEDYPNRLFFINSIMSSDEVEEYVIYDINSKIDNYPNLFLLDDKDKFIKDIKLKLK